MKKSLIALFRAIFVLPFSAGDPKNQYLNGIVTHDGSVSGVVFLVSVVVILCEILLIGSFGTEQDSTFLFVTTMEVTSGLAILICIILLIYASLKPDVLEVNDSWDVSNNIMMKFLWLFTLACLSYSCIFIAYHADCLINHYPIDDVQNRILCDVFLFTYRLVQTGFLTYFSQRVFVSKLRFYYGLLVLFLINITVIVIDFAHSVRDVKDFTINATQIPKPNTCASNSSISSILRKVEDFLEPAGLEYSLLTILFITQLWPKKKTISKNSNPSSNIQDSSSAGEYEPLVCRNENETIYDQIKKNTNSEINKRRTWIFANIAFPVLISIPSTIFLILKINTSNDESVEEALNIFNGFQVTILLFVLIKCFYLLQSDCKPTKVESHFTSKDYLILVSFVGSLCLYTMRLIPYILLVHTCNQNPTKTYTYVITIIGIYFQTVFLFQMKNYGKADIQSSWISIEYTCLFMSVVNFMIWAEDSFIAAQWVFANDAPTIFYGKMVWVIYFTLLFPFVIFYRFKCSVAFYGLYHRLSN
ncbi:uncharacterized protein LOC143045015 [Mytilus galloprovincialis]|uniref:uncharacterized protein LOC143045015 n=1 Tax=Mytilus galloprovincialis TaxID=29158 RepID=UPI003F7C7850